MQKIYDFSNKRILVVEDLEMYRLIEEKRLSMVGFSVEQAVNGAEAYRSFIEHDPFYYDVILMDIIMPKMNGKDCAKAIRTSGREDALYVPIVAISIDSSPTSIHDALAAGFDEFVEKPINFNRLFDKLEGCLATHATIQQKETIINDNKYTKLWKILIDRKMTKTDLQKMIGCSSKTMSKLSKNDNVALSTLKRICEALNCTLNDIMEIEK